MNAEQVKALHGPILVLGAAGFVGANLFHQLRQHRDDVYALVRHLPAWRLTDVTPERLLEVDLTDESAIRNLLDTLPIQTVFDCVSYGAYSFEDKATLIYRTNFLALTQFVELLARKPFAAFIHAGSSSEYGLNCAAPDEEDTLQPNSHYAVSKAGMAHFIYYAGVVRRLPCINLRLYAVYGPLEDSSRLMPALVHAAINHSYPPFVNPDITRDFVYIDDVCEAFVAAAIRINPDLYGHSYNIGTGQATSIRELAQVAKSVFAIPIDPVFGSMSNRAWDLANWYANPHRAHVAFGWQATTSLEEGLARLGDWVSTLSAKEFQERSKKDAPTRKRGVSAIIACYRDAQAIPIMHERLTKVFRRIGCEYEIIFVNDCSPDDSGDVIRELSAVDSHVLGINHSRNFGSQMAFRSGMELSTQDAVVLLDGDLQDPPEIIEEFYASWEKGFDVIYGRRIKREMPILWEFLFKSFYRIFAASSYIRIPLDAGDFSLIDRRVVNCILASPERNLFMRGLRAYVGFNQMGVDYVRPERLFGRSTNNFWKNLGWAKKAIFNYSNAPLEALSALGLILFGLALLSGSGQVALRLIRPDLAPKGVTTLLIVIMFFGSINLLGLGVLGEYIAKIMEEVKRRPRLIRSSLVRGGVVFDNLPGFSHRL